MISTILRDFPVQGYISGKIFMRIRPAFTEGDVSEIVEK